LAQAILFQVYLELKYIFGSSTLVCHGGMCGLRHEGEHGGIPWGFTQWTWKA